MHLRRRLIDVCDPGVCGLGGDSSAKWDLIQACHYYVCHNPGSVALCSLLPGKGRMICHVRGWVAVGSSIASTRGMKERGPSNNHPTQKVN